jgi:tetratricopeptide (TPR) repeat protein
MRFWTFAILFCVVTLAAVAQDKQEKIAPTSQNKVENKELPKKELLIRAKKYLAKKDLDKAIADYTALIELDDKSDDRAVLYNSRGSARLQKKEYNKAILDFTEAMKGEPNNFRFVLNRAMSYHDDGQFDKALVDYDRTLELNNKFAGTYHERGLAYFEIGEYEKALADYETGYKLDPNAFWTVYKLAMLRATCPNDKFRDGKHALEFAKRSKELTKTSKGDSAIAAAYAELGDFKKAIESQQKAIDSERNKDEQAKLQIAMELYKSNKPLRHEPKKISKK